MSKMDIYTKSLSYHVKGPQALTEGTDLVHDKNHNGIDDKQENEPKDNVVKKTKKLAKEDIDRLEALFAESDEILEALEEEGIDLDSFFEEAIEEGFQNMSKTKQLIARRRAARRKKTTAGYRQANNKLGARKPGSMQRR